MLMLSFCNLALTKNCLINVNKIHSLDVKHWNYENGFNLFYVQKRHHYVTCKNIVSLGFVIINCMLTCKPLNEKKIVLMFC